MPTHTPKQPTLFVIAGPNGAGKSSSSKVVLEPYGLEAFDWDHEFYSRWKRFDSDPLTEEGVRQHASELFIERFETAISNRTDFAFESNFHIDDHMEWLYVAQNNKFKIIMVFFFMPDIETCIERVEIRKSMGGHAVPEQEIRARYANGLYNLQKHYSLFDEVLLFDTSENYQLNFISAIEQGEVVYVNADYKHLNKLAKYIPSLG